MGHPLSTEPKRLKSQQGSDVLSSETETPANWAQLHPSFTTNCPHNGHFLQMKGQAGLGGGVGGVRTGQGDDSATLSVCHILESSRRAPLRDRAKACASDTLNADYVTLYTAPPEFRGSGSFILWVL